MELSQVALRFQAKKATARDIITASESLLQTLRTVTKQDRALDSRLAEYAFFPLSHIFRESKSVPTRALELGLQSLQILISRGWRNAIAPELAKQLLILLTFLAGGSSTEAKSKDVNEELGAIAFACSASLFHVSDAGGLSVRGSVDPANFPVLGHSVSVLLDGVSNGPSTKVRQAALKALDALVSNFSDQEALKNFLPGIVSSLTKLLSSGKKGKGPFRILEGSIQVLDKVILKVISDGDSSEPDKAQGDATGFEKAVISRTSFVIKDPWLEATSSQLKLALANILPLRYHDRDEVRRALFQLCISILGRCQKSLHQSVPMIVETSIIICAQSSEVDVIELQDNLNALMNENTDLIDVLKSSLRDWLVALPRVMQSSGDFIQERSINQISMAFKTIGILGAKFDTLDEVAINNLRASVSAAIQASAVKTIHDVPETYLEVSRLAVSNAESGIMRRFPEVMFNKTSQKASTAAFQSLMSHINSTSSSQKLRRDVIESLRTATGDEQLASLWLSLQFLCCSDPSINDSDRSIPSQAHDRNAQNILLDDVYDFSLSVLSKPTYDSDIDWRLQALSLQGVTLQARQQRADFRPELVDALYPILERLGSSNVALQHQAITALRLVSNSCDYASPRELIIDNVDYLVNAIALKLNTFDISPQAPQVLVMMLQLCGARLIPYLDDLIESIFTILEYYHGYPKLVESMFSVLSSIIEEQNKASATTITDKPEPISRIKNYKPPNIADLATHLRERLTEKPHLDPLPIPPSSLDQEAEANDELSHPSDTELPLEENPPPLSRSLQTVTSIATLTQHHLPTSSPSLRLLLLRLLPSAFTPLSHHQDTLLPLVNSLWPVLVARLYDPEPYICIAACQALVNLCRTAGDFMSSRFDNEWGKILSLAKKAEREMLVERKTMGRGGAKQRVWEAVMGLIGAVIEWVGISGEMEDGVWELVGGEGNGEGVRLLRGVLEDLNADALWLVEEKARLRKGGKVLERPVFEGVEFPEVRL